MDTTKITEAEVEELKALLEELDDMENAGHDDERHEAIMMRFEVLFHFTGAADRTCSEHLTGLARAVAEFPPPVMPEPATPKKITKKTAKKGKATKKAK